LVVPSADQVDDSPSHRYAHMSGDEAIAELDKRGVLYQRVEAARGVQTPIRLTGRLHGVEVHSSLPQAQRTTTPFEILDARLALALDDFCGVLALHDIDEVVHYSLYRPGAPPAPSRRVPAALPPLPAPSNPGMLPIASRGGHRVTAQARARHQPGGRPRNTVSSRAPAEGEPAAQAPSTSRHPAGLAIDLALLHKKSGEWLNVAAHFNGQIGAATCGAGVASPREPKARELREIVCEALDSKIFTYVLTPNFNYAHRDHFHMEIKPGVRWFLYH
jgi:hypothetical protein